MGKEKRGYKIEEDGAQEKEKRVTSTARTEEDDPHEKEKEKKKLVKNLKA